jgi:hypothetical protein
MLYSEFEKLFYGMAVNGRLEKSKMIEFFEAAGMFPTHKEVDKAFTSTFTGSM